MGEKYLLNSEEIQQIQYRTNQLFELIAFDPKNEQIYRNEIVEINIRLVSHVLSKYRPYDDDMFQLGCLGLIIASKMFDPSKGVPFANFACFCIERELHKAFRERQERVEYTYNMISLDEDVILGNGDTVSRHEQMPDIMSEEEFEKLLSDFALEELFEKIINPALEEIACSTKGQETVIDFDKWKRLELQYIIEKAEIDSQKARLNFSSMARQLGVSVQNIRMRHKRVIEVIRRKCIESGYLV